MSAILDRIVERRREHFAGLAEEVPPLCAASPSGSVNPFLESIASRRGRAVIAEVKMGSPRLGSLAGRFDPEAVARSYADHGAAALSVVVEPDFFGGSYDLLRRCKAASGLPAIAKDFVVHSRQIDEARAAGADAVLLIAAMHPAADLARYADLARGAGLVPLIETHSEDDIARLFELGDPTWEIVGVNNRNLRTFTVDLERSMALVPRLPAGALRVAESGIKTAAEIELLAGAGFDGFLIGESFLLSGDPGAALACLLAGDAA